MSNKVNYWWVLMNNCFSLRKMPRKIYSRCLFQIFWHFIIFRELPILLWSYKNLKSCFEKILFNFAFKSKKLQNACLCIYICRGTSLTSSQTNLLFLGKGLWLISWKPLRIVFFRNVTNFKPYSVDFSGLN